MAVYVFKLRTSAIGHQLLNTGYIVCSALALISVWVDLLILCSAVTLYAALRALEKHNLVAEFSCDELGEGTYQAAHLQIQAGVILTPWLICFQYQMIAAATLVSPPTGLPQPMGLLRRTIFVDQVSAKNWARLQRIGLTLNGRRR